MRQLKFGQRRVVFFTKDAFVLVKALNSWVQYAKSVSQNRFDNTPGPLTMFFPNKLQLYFQISPIV